MENKQNTQKQLFQRYLDGKASSSEKAIVEDAYRQLADLKALPDEPIDLDSVAIETFQRIHPHLRPRTVRLFPFKKWIAAAAVLIIVGAGVYLYRADRNLKGETFAVNDVAPGINGATLTLADGQKIRLTDAINGKLAEEAGVVISKAADGRLVYEVKEGQGLINKMNTLSTTNGETYQVRLPDGTAVWLNAASSITYPSSFASLKDRSVELDGEAYFEVAKDRSHPFIVRSKLQQVKVLGTHFNINSYAIEGNTKTTLLEGSVQVSSLSSGVAKMLRPGEQASVGRAIDITSADMEQAVAWKNGDFVFNGDDLKTVMRQLSRWYDIEVVYQGNVADIGFVSTISRNKKLSEVLKVLQLTQGVHFRIEGRRVTVMP